MKSRITRRAVASALSHWGAQPLSEKAFDALGEMRVRDLRGRRLPDSAYSFHGEPISAKLRQLELAETESLWYGRDFHGYVQRMRWFAGQHPPKAGERVVEIGCGLGATCLMGKHFHPKALFRGFDTNEYLIQKARLLRRRAGVKGVAFDSSTTNTAVRAASVDQVWLESPVDLASRLIESGRILKPGGVVKIAASVLEQGGVSMPKAERDIARLGFRVVRASVRLVNGKPMAFIVARKEPRR
ncbi:hypothetical protein HYS54_02085 [Candidatus Micrarchaeota archaeon]|nr:hypothetical protein [Candidatus Micrarchaeota archaeon]